MPVIDEIREANGAYAQGFGDKAELPLPPGRRFAILTCMDARLDPAKYAGLKEGDAHVIRNAGGRASDDAMRSVRSSSRTNCSAQRPGSSSIIRTVGWSCSQTASLPICSR